MEHNMNDELINLDNWQGWRASTKDRQFSNVAPGTRIKFCQCDYVVRAARNRCCYRTK